MSLASARPGRAGAAATAAAALVVGAILICLPPARASADEIPLFNKAFAFVSYVGNMDPSFTERDDGQLDPDFPWWRLYADVTRGNSFGMWGTAEAEVQRRVVDGTHFPSVHMRADAHASYNLQAATNFVAQAEARYQEGIRLDLRNDDRLAQVGLQLRTAGEIVIDNQARGDSRVNFVFGGAFGGRSLFNEQHNYDGQNWLPLPPVPPPWQPHEERDLERSIVVLIPEVLAILGSWRKLEVFAMASVWGGDGRTLVDFGNSMHFEGFIPYDADGNMLPSTALSVTTQTGYPLPVIGSDTIPEPATGGVAAILIACALATSRPARPASPSRHVASKTRSRL